MEFESSKDTFLVIGCGKAKIWDRHPHFGKVCAKDAYVGGLFRLSRLYAETFYPHRWLILSARYGLVLPSEPIANYDVSFNSGRSLGKNMVLNGNTVTKQSQYYFKEAKKVVCITGENYVRVLKASLQKGIQIECPLAHMGLYARMAWLKAEIRNINSSVTKLS